MTNNISPYSLPISKKDHALAYVAQGLAVFPLHYLVEGHCSCGKPDCSNAGKHPMTLHGLKDASRDPAQIAAWWDAHPEANIGLPTGLINGFLAIDVDPKHDGFEAIKKLWELYGPLPLSWQSRTGSGGVHMVFRCPPGRTIKSRTGHPLPGIDIRGDGGYIVAPPSNHRSGAMYAWEPGRGPGECPLADLTEAWLEAICAKGAPGEKAEKAPFILPQSIGEGQRNRTLFECAASLRAQGLPMRVICQRVHEVNAGRCIPPLPDDEVNRILDSVDKYPAGASLPTTTAEEDFGTSQYTGNDLSTYKPDDFTDAGNAAVFGRFTAGRLIWSDDRGYLRDDGQYWAEDQHAAMGMGEVLTRRMLDEARRHLAVARDKVTHLQTSQQAADNPEAVRAELESARAEEGRAEKYWAFVLKSRAAPRINGFTQIAKSAYLVIPSDRLDSNPFLLNTPAGMVDLNTGSIRPHDSAEYCTSITTVAPGSMGRELWEEHLRTITCGDPELQRFHQAAAGMALIGRVYCENLLIALGGGKNGKSTHYNVQLMVLGTGYARTLNPEVLTTDKRNAGADLATLKGKRFIVAGELEEGKRLSTSVLKRLTSTDPISAERKFYDPETFTPSHSTVLYTNHMPRLGSIDEGTRRRIKVIPFNAVISPNAEQKNYTQHLYENAGGAILSWMIEGTQLFIRNGFQLPSCRAVNEATDKYFTENDWVGAFLEECCVTGKGQTCGGGALYSAYRERAEAEGEYVRRSNDLAAELEKRGFVNQHTKRGSVWYELSVRPGWRVARDFQGQSWSG